MLPVTEQIAIQEDEIEEVFLRAGGPGGQNVNKVASKAVLRWNPGASPSIPREIKERLLVQQQKRLTATGDLVITSQRFRDQERNRQDCREKLAHVICLAAFLPKPRKPTRPSRSSNAGRLLSKKHWSRRKALRRKPLED